MGVTTNTRRNAQHVTGKLPDDPLAYGAIGNSWKFIKMSCFRVSRLFLDIRDMQYGAKCCDESISDIRFDPSGVETVF